MYQNELGLRKTCLIQQHGWEIQLIDANSFSRIAPAVFAVYLDFTICAPIAQRYSIPNCYQYRQQLKATQGSKADGERRAEEKEKAIQLDQVPAIPTTPT